MKERLYSALVPNRCGNDKWEGRKQSGEPREVECALMKPMKEDKEKLKNQEKALTETGKAEMLPLAGDVEGKGLGLVLIIDHEEAFRNSLSKMLSDFGYETLLVGSSQKGLDLCHKYPVDLVLADIDMPDTDGWALASHIKEKFPNISVILMSDLDKQGVLGKIESSSADLVIFKPIGLLDISKTVQKVLGGSNS
ncbi:MAG: response regulator [Thermodesulfobacteriota bacterium]